MNIKNSLKRKIIVLFVILTIFSLCSCEVNSSGATLPSNSSSVASDEIIIKHSMEEVNITQEFASELQDKTNRLVVETLQLAGDNIKVCPKNECTCITAGENLLSFYTAVAQGIDTYLCRADWVKEDEDWTATFLEINGEDIFNY